MYFKCFIFHTHITCYKNFQYLVLILADIDWTSRCTFPLAPSAHNVILVRFDKVSIVGHTFGSSAQVTSCSPVAGLHRLLNSLKGILISENSSPVGTESFALNSLENKAPKETLNAGYSGVLLRILKTKSPEIAVDTSLKFPSAWALINPGAWSDGTSLTSPSSIPNPSSSFTFHDPDEMPPFLIKDIYIIILIHILFKLK